MTSLDSTPNVLVMTLDSCRWDTFRHAKTPIIDSLGVMRKAYAQATFTYAAHLSMYQGHFPNTEERIPYYDRFTKPLFRIANTSAIIDSAFSFPAGTQNIVAGFRRAGYYTFGFGAMGWFRHSDLCSPFDFFKYTGINADLQIAAFLARVSNTERPFFCLINFGETHEPYAFGGEIPACDASLARIMVRGQSRVSTFDGERWMKQVLACEFLDSRFDDIVSQLRSMSRRTIVVVCADHGECFGENGLYGHGFYHHKVMEVPLGIFDVG